jgi:hypothetical protein
MENIKEIKQIVQEMIDKSLSEFALDIIERENRGSQEWLEFLTNWVTERTCQSTSGTVQD